MAKMAGLYKNEKLGAKGHELEKFRVGMGWEALRGATLGAWGSEPEGQRVLWKGNCQHTYTVISLSVCWTLHKDHIRATWFVCFIQSILHTEIEMNFQCVDFETS